MSDEMGGLAGEVRRLRAENDDLRKRPPARTGLLGQALAHIVQAEIELKALRAENADLRKRLDETLRSGLDVTHRRIDRLADRVAMLERVRWESEGEM